MENVAYIGLSRLTTMRRQLDVVANNIANMNAPAFKAEKMMFQEYVMRSSERIGMKQDNISFVRDYGTTRNMAEGEFQVTGNSLDVAIAGPGFLAVDTPVGPRYTRNGRLKLDSQGQITDANGYPLLDDQGRRVQINGNRGEITIAHDGTISMVNQNVTQNLGRLSIVTFANAQALTTAGGGLYAAPEGQTPIPATDVTVRQGVIEGSNVQPVVELTSMVELSRAYDAAEQMLQSDTDRQRKAIDRLARITA